jgi:hypothetical protein
LAAIADVLTVSLQPGLQVTVAVVCATDCADQAAGTVKIAIDGSALPLGVRRRESLISP